jgi:hypothetical protein
MSKKEKLLMKHWAKNDILQNFRENHYERRYELSPVHSGTTLVIREAIIVFVYMNLT